MYMSTKEYQRDWYAKNREVQRLRANGRVEKARHRNMKLRALYLSARPCMDCGEPPDPDTPFEFDHRLGMQNGSRRVSDLITKGTNHIRMLREFEHCDVVCASCHKQRTYDRRQWKRVRFCA
jgi:hypothetical protein